jgi:uncharacterized protein HemX
MSEWLQWGINLLVVTAVGLIGFFAKRTLTQIDARHEEAAKRLEEQQRKSEEKILKELERFRADNDSRHQKTELRMERVEDRLNKTLQEMPTMYTLREDWLRTSSDIARKLDKITDILINGGGRRSEE